MSDDGFARLFQRDQDGADAFVEGYYLLARQGHVSLPVRIWFGPPIDVEAPEPQPGEEWPTLDRAPRWQVMVSGVLLDDERVDQSLAPAPLAAIWPGCLGHPTRKSDYFYRLARIGHARAYRPDDPFAHRRGRVDWLTADVFD
jgi:hypothetical protein